jgi:hypothetical protein
LAETLIGYEALQARLQRLGHMDARLMDMLRMQAVREVKQRAPRKTGNLSRSIGSARVSDTEARVYARADYAASVEKGARPHDITPNAKKALRFALGSGARLTGSPRVGAGVIFAMVVHHPGNKPHPYLEPGVKAAIQGAGLANEVKLIWEGE